ncbi:MAG: hypothetical protein AAGN82_19865 [Myxococcota bacterium]
MRWRIVWVALWVAAGCGGAASDDKPRGTSSRGDEGVNPLASPSVAPNEAVGAAARPDGPAYSVAIEGWEGPVGEEGYVLVAVTAEGGHKINREYPQRVQLRDGGPDLELPLRRVGLSDAQLEGEERLVFTLPAVPKRVGQHQLRGEIKLSVCAKGQCRTATEPLVARVTAQ